jgi:hypothetical protein
MGKQEKIRIVILFAAHRTSYFLNLAREQKSLATPGIEYVQKLKVRNQLKNYKLTLFFINVLRGPISFT